MEWELNLENGSDHKLEADGNQITDAYPPKLERQDSQETTEWPPRLARLLNPALLVGDIVKEIASDLAKKGAEDTSELPGVTDTPQTNGEFSPAEKEWVRQDAQARKEAMLEKYDRLQSQNQDRINQTLARLDQLKERQDDNLRRMTTFDAPNYTGV